MIDGLIEVYATFDNLFQTWNIINSSSGECLSYGSIEDAEQWLEDNKNTHKEI